MLDSLESLGYLLEGTLREDRKGLYLVTDKGIVYLTDISGSFLGKDVRVTLVDLDQAEQLQEKIQRLSDADTVVGSQIPCNLGSDPQG